MALKRHKIKHKGFSLIELLVVIAIIGVLSALLMGAIRKGIQSAQRARAANYIRQIIIAYTGSGEMMGIKVDGALPFISPHPLCF